ncbi:MAG: hypothetical protein DELT_00101 [Desulfovibrio sp.]
MGAEKLPADPGLDNIRQRFRNGRFPVATIDHLEGREPFTALGLVVTRGYSSEETFFSMLCRAEAKGAHGIIGYRESVAFHPDGTRFYTCYGTAVAFE